MRKRIIAKQNSNIMEKDCPTDDIEIRKAQKLKNAYIDKFNLTMSDIFS
jgi:hypothetical protein